MPTWLKLNSYDGLLSGIVGYANLSAPGIADIIAAHVEAGGGKFRGVRQGAAWDPDPNIHMSHVMTTPGMLTDPSFARGVAELARQSLTCDIYVYFHQLPELAELARAVPEATIILNHLGGILGVGEYAASRSAVRATWRTHLTAVAACANVVLKVGGLGRPLGGTGWVEASIKPTPDEVSAYWGPDVLWAIEQFGTSRCMFESNFPVDGKCFSYSTCWNTFSQLTSDWSHSDRRALFHDTAARTYRLFDEPAA